MSDVVVSVTESTTAVTVTEQDVAVAVTENTVEVSSSTAGVQGATGAQGASGVISVTSPVTNSGSASSAVLGLDQTALSLTRSQITDFTSGTVTSASTAQQSGTAVFASVSGVATSATSAATATNAGTAVYATTSGTAVSISGSITQSQVTSLVTDLAGKASLGSANTFTVGAQTINTGATANKGLVVQGVANQSANLFEVQTASATAVRINQVGNSTFVGNITSQNNATFTPASAATVPLKVQCAASQSANLQEWQNSAGTILAKVDSGGGIFGPNGAKLGLDTFTGVAYNGISNPAGITTIPSLVVKGIASQTANLQEWHNSGGTALSFVRSDGVVRAPAFGTTNNYAFTVERNSGGELNLVRQTAQTTSPGSNNARLYFRDGTNAGTLKLVVRAGASGAETTILDNIPQT